MGLVSLPSGEGRVQEGRGMSLSNGHKPWSDNLAKAINKHLLSRLMIVMIEWEDKAPIVSC